MAFRYKEPPRVAEDARCYGIHEVIPGDWNTYSTLPITIRPELGSVGDLTEAVQKARQHGVNLVPFISVSILRNKYSERYGVQPSDSDWTYHNKLIPQFRPYCTDPWNGVEINTNNKIWQADIFNALGD